MKTIGQVIEELKATSSERGIAWVEPVRGAIFSAKLTGDESQCVVLSIDLDGCPACDEEDGLNCDNNAPDSGVYWKSNSEEFGVDYISAYLRWVELTG